LSAATNTLGLADGTLFPSGLGFASDSPRVAPLDLRLPAIARSVARILRALALIDSSPRNIFVFPTFIRIRQNTIPYYWCNSRCNSAAAFREAILTQPFRYLALIATN
jgi:hypothetical protein